MIKIGPSGIGGVKDAEQNLSFYKEKYIDLAEVAYTYSVYLKIDDAKRIGRIAKKNNIDLSIHGHYYINLNSDDKKKISMSKKRILACCESAHYLGAKKVVFHPGFYGKFSKEETYENIKNEIIDLIKEIKKNNWNVELCPETTGKVNVFGSLDETLNLVKDTGCSFCVDFAHLKARNIGKIDFNEVVNKLSKFKNIHCHYSGINYGEKGERNHEPVDLEEWKELVKILKKSKSNFNIVCESPDPFKDAVRMKSVL